MDRLSMYKSWLLSDIMETSIGSKEQIAIRRRETVMNDYTQEYEDMHIFTSGSSGEGFSMEGSDLDVMIIFKDIIAVDPKQHLYVPTDSLPETILYTKKANCRPGYVALEVHPQGQLDDMIRLASISDGDTTLLSSEMFREQWNDRLGRATGISGASSGPCHSVTIEQTGKSYDLATSLRCMSWPQEAYEWATRVRLYGWPSQLLIDTIVKEGCHLVPVGDKCSKGTALQWRISFATAERKLIYSLSYVQFKVYGLLKYLLKQIKGILRFITGEDDILCSYFLKTIIFFAVENSPSSLWQEKHTFVCFMFCFNILIDWVKSAYCPNYFVPANNMFQRKVHGKNRQKLLHVLLDVHNRKWECLSVGNFFTPSIGDVLQSILTGEIQFCKPTVEEVECAGDMEIPGEIFTYMYTSEDGSHSKTFQNLGILLAKSQSHRDEVIYFCKVASVLTAKARDVYCEKPNNMNNKQRYNTFRKCKRLLAPLANLCTSPGQLFLATFYYNVGNYREALKLCGNMTSSFKILTNLRASEEDKIRYQSLYCGKGYSFYHKCKEVFVANFSFEREQLLFCPSQIRPDVSEMPIAIEIPPLPYAAFLSFLCYHDLGDSKKCTESLQHLQTICSNDEEQGGEKYFIVYNFLSICYQTVGDKHMAVKACTDSILAMPSEYNYAWKRIKFLQIEGGHLV